MHSRSMQSYFECESFERVCACVRLSFGLHSHPIARLNMHPKTGVRVTSQCTITPAGPGAGVAGIAMTTTVANIGQAPVTLGRCELLRIPRSAVPSEGLRLLQYELRCAQSPMVMVDVGASSGALSCNTLAMLHTPQSSPSSSSSPPPSSTSPSSSGADTSHLGATSAGMGGAIGFLTWRRCATVVEVQPTCVVAHCDAAGFSLEPGDTITLETAWLSDWAPPQVVWDAWPTLAAKSMSARLPAGGRTPVGWLCWSWQDPTAPALSNATCAEDL